MIDHSLVGAGLGVIIGAVLALTGAGGGILAVPLLVFGLGLTIVEAAPVACWLSALPPGSVRYWGCVRASCVIALRVTSRVSAC
ncbi:hypothetical protein PSA5_01750 [Pseudomonas syringae pv. actinidiae]|nr:hypothetical protein PSA5_01750 [Pseudomonas syringae pv. actinidiae]